MGGQGYPPEILRQAGVIILLCSGLGRRAIKMFEGFGIEVFIGAAGSVKNALEMWRTNQLVQATDQTACRQHSFRDENHHRH